MNNFLMSEPALGTSINLNDNFESPFFQNICIERPIFLCLKLPNTRYKLTLDSSYSPEPTVVVYVNSKPVCSAALVSLCSGNSQHFYIYIPSSLCSSLTWCPPCGQAQHAMCSLLLRSDSIKPTSFVAVIPMPVCLNTSD